VRKLIAMAKSAVRRSWDILFIPDMVLTLGLAWP
jgi:hypothetical protein